MLKVSQVAERLGCSLGNAYALIERGKLAAVKVGAGGRGYRVTEEELARFIEEGQQARRPLPWPDKCKPSRPVGHNVQREWF